MKILVPWIRISEIADLSNFTYRHIFNGELVMLISLFTLSYSLYLFYLQTYSIQLKLPVDQSEKSESAKLDSQWWILYHIW